MSRIAGILLAAGRGTRIGRPKALLRWGAETFVSRAVRNWSTVCDPVIVVAGASVQEVKAAVPPPGVVVFNPRFDAGMFTSVQLALAEVPDSCDAVIMGPVDQPLLDAGLLLELRTAWEAAPDRVIVPEHGGAPGHPVVLPRALFPAIAAEPDTSNLGRVLSAHGELVQRLPLDRPEIVRNINTPEEYRAFMTEALVAEEKSL